MHSAQELATSIEKLASLPAVYHRIREQLESPDGSVSEAARLVAIDPALTSRLLHVVNSAMYGFSGQIATVSRAVQLLGLRQVHDLVLSMSLSAVFDGLRPAVMDVPRFWRNSVLRALAARAGARMRGVIDAERMFVEGLLADIGHLVMYHTIPHEVEEARLAAKASQRPIHEVEQASIGCDFAEVGGTLLGLWRLPSGIASAVAGQNEPRLAGEHSFEATLLLLANRIAEADEENLTSEEAAQRIAQPIWSQLGLAPENLATLREDAELNLAAVMTMFFPSLRGR
ncbi:MAG: HDOD domain-containing protein [Rhodocyclaceae bacterium]|nr:HDOD domain-containing protein [Rhodocyclaceae bacterium]